MTQMAKAHPTKEKQKIESVAALLQQATERFEQGQSDQAKEILFTALRQRPRHWQTLNDLGVILFQESNFAEAEKHFRQSLQSKPKNLDALLNLIHLYWAQKEYGAALLHGLKAFQRFPTRPEAKSILLKVYVGIVQQFCFSDPQSLEQQFSRLRNYPKLISQVRKVLAQEEQWDQEFTDQQRLLLEALLAIIVEDTKWFILNLKHLKIEPKANLETVVLFIWGLLLGHSVFDANFLIQQLSRVYPEEKIIPVLQQVVNVLKAETTSSPAKSLRIGFVTLWFERGQSYVTKTLRDVIAHNHETFVFARTGGVYGQPKLETEGFWNVPNLTTYPQYQIPPDVLINWICDNRLDVVVFNEEYDWNLVQAARNTGAKIVTYLDYYKDDWKPYMRLYDAVLCSTLRTFHLVKDFCDAHYVSWAVDTDLFQPDNNGEEKYTFFHNAGWLGINYRKMTTAVILAFDAICQHLSDVTLFVHAQADLEKLPPEIVRIVHQNPRITYHVETVPAPGLYHKGRMLVFPSKLEGLGLPLLEGMACGLPVIATDVPPMNEFVRDGENGLLVRVAKTVTRQDHIAFPETIVDVNDLAVKMGQLALEPTLTHEMGCNARRYAEEELTIENLGARVYTALDHLYNRETSRNDCKPISEGSARGSINQRHVDGFEGKVQPLEGFDNRSTSDIVSKDKAGILNPNPGLIADNSLKVTGYLAKRSWCMKNAEIIRYLQGVPHLYMHGTRFWEYAFVFEKVMKRPNSRIVDIGIGEGIFPSLLAKHGHQIVGVDNYESCWDDMEKVMAKTGIKCIHADARNLEMFQDAEFDIALLISVIEHIPSNTIFCEKRQVPKTGAMLREEIPEKLKVISEAVRMVKPGGLVILTSDIYLDYPPDVNISWRGMLGLEGIDRADIHDMSDLYVSDNPIHKGRVLPVGIILEKKGHNAVQESLLKAFDEKKYWVERHKQLDGKIQSVGHVEWSDEINTKVYKLRIEKIAQAFDRLSINLQGKYVLDMGCGIGIFAKWLAENGAKVTGVDIAPDAIRHAQRNVPGGQFFVADVCSFTSSIKFDVIMCIDILYHITDDNEWGRCLQKCASLLSKEGTLLIVDKFLDGEEKTMEHICFRSNERYEQLLQTLGLSRLFMIDYDFSQIPEVEYNTQVPKVAVYQRVETIKGNK